MNRLFYANPSEFVPLILMDSEFNDLTMIHVGHLQDSLANGRLDLGFMLSSFNSCDKLALIPTGRPKGLNFMKKLSYWLVIIIVG